MDAYIVEAKRTPIGRAHKDKGIYREVRADELMAHLLKDFGQRVLSPEKVDDVMVGCVGQHLEQGKNIARLSSLLAGYPDAVPGVTINRLCASSLQAFHFASQSVALGQNRAVLAGGVEHMHHVPMVAALDYNQELLKRYEFPFTNMGLTAEKVADQFGISRQEQDAFAVESHRKAVVAQKEGYFKAEIVATPAAGEMIEADQGPRATTSMEALADLKTVFKEEGGTVTAGNSSQISDGASLTLLANKESCSEFGLKAKARVVDFAVVGLDPLTMGLGPIPAIQKLLKKQNKTVADIDCFELNEAFASQAIACVRELNLDESKVNPTGGAIALGHPLGCTGTRLVATLLNNLTRLDKEWGVISMCIGHGQGIATLIQRTS
ncbi:MAG: thiolase family protein [Bdellovibrionales bacterium]|nr:thiolase family protein [Bdellovibrionales bacterium]